MTEEVYEIPDYPNFAFSVEEVENAANMIQNSGTQVAESISYLETWKKNPDSIFQACEVIRTSENLNAHFFSALVLDHNIPNTWRDINEEDKEQIRSFISQQIFTYDNVLIIRKMSMALAHIAVFDFPQQWEGYETYLFPDDESCATFLMLEAFFEDVDTSKYITEQRRQRLKNDLNSRIDFFLPRIQFALENPDLCENAINAYKAMIKWAPNSAVRNEFIEAIFLRFIPVESTLEVGVDCLKKIFLQRNDSDSLFHTFKYQLLQLLSGTKLSNEQSITNIPIVLKFLISLFNKYMMPIEKMAIESPDPNVRQHFEFLITTILSIPTDKMYIPNKFWIMWYGIFNRIVEQKIGTMRFDFATQLFMPILQTIIQSLYVLLPESIDEDGVLKAQAQNCFAKLLEIDFDEVKNFLEQQNPSSSLSYALGSLLSVRAPRQDLTCFVQIVEVLFKESTDKIDYDDDEYIVALMYGFSRSASFLSTLGHFGRFLELAITCLRGSDDVMCNAATHALLYTAQVNPDLFFADDTQIILDDLIAMSENFIEFTSEASAYRMFECLATLIAQMNEPAKFEELYQPIYIALSNPPNEKIVRTCLYIISKLCKAKTKIKQKDDGLGLGQPEPIDYLFGQDFAPLVNEPTYELAKAVIVDTSSDINDIELLLSSLSSLIGCIDSYENAEEPIKDVLSLFFERNEILPCFFTFITSVRITFGTDMNSVFSDIMQSFVYPLIPEDASEVSQDVPLAEILTMVSKFQYAPTDVEWVVKVGLGEGLLSYNEDVNKAATKAVTRVFREMETNDLRSLFGDIGVQIFEAVFNSLADSMHKPSSTALIKLIFNMCILVKNREEFPDALKSFILEALEHVFENNEEDLFSLFMDFIVRSIEEADQTESYRRKPLFKQFEEGVLNFLIMQNKYSPGDANEFKLYKKKHLPFFAYF